MLVGTSFLHLSVKLGDDVHNIYECHREPSQHCLPKNCAIILLSNLQEYVSSGVRSRGLQVEDLP